MPVSSRMKRMPNCVGICIDEAKEGFKGRVYNCYSKEPDRFTDITEMFYIIENVMDTLNFPALKTKCRTFKRSAADFKPTPIDVENKILGAEELIPEGEENGYVLMITSRDNVTWQGMLYDKKKDEENSFNSEVELIRLLK